VELKAAVAKSESRFAGIATTTLPSFAGTAVRPKPDRVRLKAARRRPRNRNRERDINCVERGVKAERLLPRRQSPSAGCPPFVTA
jgi:hypothetical protein